MCKNVDGTVAEFNNDVGHNQPSVVVDGAGYIHVFTSMHVNLLRYFRSARPGDVSQMVDATLTFRMWTGYWTYETGRGPDGDVYCLMRVASRSTTGKINAGCILYRFDVGALRWTRYAHVAETANRAIYPDDIAINEDGVHLLFQWSAYPSSGPPCREMASSGTDGLMRTINNTPLPMPVTQGQLAYKPVCAVCENPAISDGLKMGIQSAKFAFDGEGLSHITYRFRTVEVILPEPGSVSFGVYVATWAGSAWSEQADRVCPAGEGNTSAALAATVQGASRGCIFAGGIHCLPGITRRCHCPGGKCRFWMGLLGTRQQRPHTSAPGSARRKRR
ncbi:BNR-4 repeat-containing protein [Klebsiella pneumoniae]